MRYPVVLADPPWSYYGSPDKWAAAGKHYDLLDHEEVYTFNIHDFLDKPGVLFLWATCPKLHIAIKAIEEWGLHYRGVAFVWVKTRKSDGMPIGAQGVRPSIVKPLTELVLAASTEARGRPLPIASEAVVQTVLAPRRKHSQKPDQVQERIEELYPDLPKIELFARRKRPGWDVWGEEVENTSDWMEEVTPTTACKHGNGDCPKCGTTSRRDAIHTTIGGKGVVGRLRRK